MATDNYYRHYYAATMRAMNAVGGPRTFDAFGPVIRRGLVAAELLAIAAGQDESISAETVRRMVGSFNDRLISRDNQQELDEQEAEENHGNA